MRDHKPTAGTSAPERKGRPCPPGDCAPGGAAARSRSLGIPAVAAPDREPAGTPAHAGVPGHVRPAGGPAPERTAP